MEETTIDRSSNKSHRVHRYQDIHQDRNKCNTPEVHIQVESLNKSSRRIFDNSGEVVKVFLAIQCHLAGTRLSPHHAQFEHDLPIVHHRQSLRHGLCRSQVSPLLQLESRATQFKRVVQAFLDLDVLGPAVRHPDHQCFGVG